MKSVFLAALFGARLIAAVVYTAVDDPRCHDEPGTPVIEPSPSPSPYPVPPTPVDEFATTTTAATTPICAATVTGLKIYNVAAASAGMDLVNGSTLKLTDLPTQFGIQAIVEEGVKDVTFTVNGGTPVVDSLAPFVFDAPNALYTKGVFTITATADSDENCQMSVQITLDYGNEHYCKDGVVSHFALFDVISQAIVPGYEVLTNGQTLDHALLPKYALLHDRFSIIAVTNAYANGPVEFSFNGLGGFHTESSAPYAISGKHNNGEVKPFNFLLEDGTISILAKSFNMVGEEMVDEACELSITIDTDFECLNFISGFALIEAYTGKPVPGYEKILGYRRINLANVPKPLSLEALGSNLRGARFYCPDCVWQDDNVHSEGFYPFAMNGDSGRNYFNPVIDLVTPGTYEIEATGRVGGEWEPRSKACLIVLEIDGITTIDNDDYCAPEQIALYTVGNQVFQSPPVEVVSIDVNNTVFFNTKNTINGHKMDWITTSFVTVAGVEVCDKIDNFAYSALSDHVYEAKCFDGFAYADIYAYSADFSDAQASADTSILPAGCRNDFEGKVIRYSFVFSCDCENIPDIPDEVKGVEAKLPICSGPMGEVFGEPHIYPFDAVTYNCQGEGEFLISAAEIVGRDYNFELHARHTRYRWMVADNSDMPWTWNDGIVAKQDVAVQLSVAEVPDPAYSMQFDDMYVNFYVDGVQRHLNQGTGDHRVLVSVKGRHITVLFTATGIEMVVEVRPFSTTSALHGVMSRSEVQGMVIPGCFTTKVCFPSDNNSIKNFVGMWGTPNGDKYDDYKYRDGTSPNITNIDSKWFDRTEYCLDWCVSNPEESIFTYEENYGFDYYNYCDAPARRDLSESACELTEEAIATCESELDAVDVEQCKMETCAHPDAGKGFIKDEVEIQKREMMAVYQPAQDDFAGCSLDFKTTVKDPDNADSGFAKCVNRFDCELCLGTNVFTWLSSGDLESECVELGGFLLDGQKCCPGLTDLSNTCTFVEGGRRRLANTKNLRPDIPEGRNIVTLRSEL